MTVAELHIVVAVMLLLWSALLWLAGLAPASRAWSRKPSTVLILGAVATGLTLLPLGEFTLWRWMMSAHANPSVLLVTFLAAFVGGRLAGRAWLSVRERRTAYVIGFLVGLVLYGSATGYLGPDLYAKAWESRLVVGVTGLLAAVLIGCGSRIGILLVLALVANMANLLESDNAWDYIIDPAFWLLSLYGLSHWGFRALKRRWTGERFRCLEAGEGVSPK